MELEGKEILTMGNFYYGGITKKDWYNYTKDEILTQLILYDRHTIIKKKIAFETNLDIKMIIKQGAICIKMIIFIIIFKYL